jgi:hypothetical protein
MNESQSTLDNQKIDVMIKRQYTKSQEQEKDQESTKESEASIDDDRRTRAKRVRV